MLPAFTCAGAIGNLWIICVGVHILRLGWFETLSEKPAPSIFIGNFLLSKELRTLSVSTFQKIIYIFKNISFLFFSLYFWVIQNSN